MSSRYSYRARESRLQFTPSYVLVGAYRLTTDPNLYRPIWDKVKHGVRRGAVVAFGWTVLTFNIQRAFIKFFLVNSPRVTGLSHETVFGYKVPLDIVTYATVMFLSSQFNVIMFFFLSRNLRIARDRAWDHTIKSRGKSPDFWQPYVEEWQVPPEIDPTPLWHKFVSNGFSRFLIRRILLAPLDLYPFVGIIISSSLKAIGTARYLHKPYFAAKKMTQREMAIFVKERKWDYRGVCPAFGFVSALLEGLPIVGMAFSISNRIGAAMWAHDLEKRQHLFASGELQPIPPHQSPIPHGDTELRHRGSGMSSSAKHAYETTKVAERPQKLNMAGGWEDETL